MTDGLEANIKKYTEQLAQDPKSRVFVPLCDAYRQLGRFEEAISVAQEGMKHHPTYLSGKLALARALFENGDADPAFDLLESILQTSPDNLLANRILAEICVQKGERARAAEALRGILDAEPNDARARKMLDSLTVLPASAASTPTSTSDPAPPMRTPTLAELYRAQGHKKEALEVYRELLLKDAMNPTYAAKVSELEREMAPTPSPMPPARSDRTDRRHIFEKLLGRIQERRRTV